MRIVNKYILTELGAKRIDQIDAERIQDFQERLKERLADKTSNDIMCVFKSIWKFGHLKGYPCCDWVQSGIKVKKTKEITIISQEVRSRMAKAFSEYNQYVAMGICFSLLTGVRIGEICGLRWGDIDLQNGYATIQYIMNSRYQRKRRIRLFQHGSSSIAQTVAKKCFETLYARALGC